MATTITATNLSDAGVDPSAGRTNGDAAGHVFANDGKVLLEVVSQTGAVTVTIDTPQSAGGASDLPIAQRVITLGSAGLRRLVGPFPPFLYNQRTGADLGRVLVTYDTPANASVKLYNIPSA